MTEMKPNSADFPWLQERHSELTLLRLPAITAESLLALLEKKSTLEKSSAEMLGRGGGVQVDDPALGAVRIKQYSRGGLFGKFFPQSGLDETAARR